jgi:hypothetical protein
MQKRLKEVSLLGGAGGWYGRGRQRIPASSDAKPQEIALGLFVLRGK